MRKILEDANRFTAVSLPALKELGVSGVCWLGCCEVHSGAGDEAPDGKDWSSGAFVYIYDNPEYDCYFSVSTVNEDGWGYEQHKGFDLKLSAAQESRQMTLQSEDVKQLGTFFDPRDPLSRMPRAVRHSHAQHNQQAMHHLTALCAEICASVFDDTPAR